MKRLVYTLGILIMHANIAYTAAITPQEIPPFDNMVASLEAQKQGVPLSLIPLFFNAFEKYPNDFPQGILPALKNLIILSPTITKDVAKQLITITGTINFWGTKCAVKLFIMHTGKTLQAWARNFNVFCSSAPIRSRLLIAPPGTVRLSTAFPTLQQYDKIEFSNPHLWLSTITTPYTDPLYTNEEIRAGAAFYGKVNINNIGLGSQYVEEINHITNLLGCTPYMGNRISKNLSATSLNFNFTPSKQILIGKIINCAQLALPTPFITMVNSIPLESPYITFSWWSAHPSLTINGNLPIGNKDIAVHMYIKKELGGRPYAEFKLPEKFTFSSLIPAITQLDTAQSAILYLTTFPFTLADGTRIEQGLTVIAQTTLSRLSFDKALKDKLGKLIITDKKITIKGTIPAAAEKTSLYTAIELSGNTPVQQFINTTKIIAPENIKQNIASSTITNPVLYLAITGKTINSSSIQGPITIANATMNAQLQFIQQTDASCATYLVITPPTNWKISTLFPTLKNYDTLPLQDFRITIADTTVIDPVTQQSIAAGVGFAVTLRNFSMFSNLDTFVQRIIAPLNPAIKTTNGLIFIGTVDQNGTTIRTTLPTNIHCDCTALATKKSPPTTAFIEKIAIGASTITLSPDGKADITAPITISYKGQTAPITYTALIDVTTTKATLTSSPSSLSLNPLFNKSWLALTEGRLDIVFEYAKLQPKNPLPTSVTLTGVFTIENGTKKFIGQGSGSIDLTSEAARNGKQLTIPITGKIYNKYGITGTIQLPFATPDEFTLQANLGPDFTNAIVQQVAAVKPITIKTVQATIQTSRSELQKGILPKVNIAIPLPDGKKLELNGFAFDSMQTETFFKTIAQNIISNWPQ